MDDVALLIGYQAISVCLVGVALHLATRQSAYPLALFVAGVSAVATCVFVVSSYRSSLSPDIAGFVKFLCEMPLGLGSLAAFQCFPALSRVQWHRHFVMYVNVAVVGNIAMMVFVPDGGTMRGWSARVACVTLVVWLLREMKDVMWVTQPLPTQTSSSASKAQPLFIFTAVPIEWVVVHAAYRAVMVTLPAFDTPRYLLLEALSLSAMVWLHQRHVTSARRWATSSVPVNGARQPPPSPFHLKDFFGLADTIVVATMGTTSHIADAFMMDGTNMRSIAWRAAVAAAGEGDAHRWWLWGGAWVDVFGVIVHVVVVLVSIAHVMAGRRA